MASDGHARTQDVQDFIDGFDELARAVRRARGATAAGSGHPLTLSQYGLLQPLAGGAQARVGELAAQAGITASTATRILDALERRGMVARTQADGDRRAVAVALTPEGETTLSAQVEWMRSRQRAFFAALADDERAVAPELLCKLAALIDTLAAG
jgi:DNA-binding MarR family transcriptional regulator